MVPRGQHAPAGIHGAAVSAEGGRVSSIGKADPTRW